MAHGNATAFIAKFVKEGMSSSAALNAYRSAGGKIRTQSWYKLYGEAQAVIVRREAVSKAPANRRPLAEHITTWTTTKQRGYSYQFEIQVRHRGTGAIESVFHAVRTDKLISYGRALARAMETFDPVKDSADYQVLGGIVTGVFQLVPETA